MNNNPQSLSRRQLLGKGALAGGALLLSSAAMAKAKSKQERPSKRGIPNPVYASEYKVKNLPFNPAKLTGLSERLIVSHHDKNYAGAVKRLFNIQQRIAALPEDVPAYMMGSLKREELIAMNSMILHELYFGNLGGSGAVGGQIAQLIKDSFGSVDAWQHEFKLTGKSLAGGSGWVILAYSTHDKRVHNVWASDHQVNLAGALPLLVMDMYEHSYQMDYGADARAYIEAFFSNINWQQVDERVKQHVNQPQTI